MNIEDIRTRKLRLSEQLLVRFAKCPECGGKLAQEMLPELAESWSYVMPKYTARLLGNRPAPKSHVTEVPEGWHCPRCDRWYLKSWVYWQDAL